MAGKKHQTDDRQTVFQRVAAGELSVEEAEAILADEFPPEAEPARRAKAPSVETLVTLAAHGVAADYARELFGAGITDLSVLDMVGYAKAGVTAALLAALRQSGPAATPAEVIGMGMNGVDADMVRELHEVGLGFVSAGELITLGARGVRPRQLAELRAAGFDRFSVDELIGMVLNGMDGDRARELAGRGVDRLSAGEVIALAAQEAGAR